MADIAVVGGGLAGAALAIRLAERNRRVVLVERERGPHDKVCGEFLSREALLHLATLGVDAQTLGGLPIGRVRLSAGRWTAATALPFEGAGLSRRVLDEALLCRAAGAGATVLRGRRARSLEPHDGGHRIRLDDNAMIDARDAVLATGKHDLRGWKRAPGRQNDLVGFKLHLRLAPAQRRAVDGHVELTLFPGGYAGLQLVSAETATLCLLVRRCRLPASGGSWPVLLRSICAGAPLLARRLADAEPLHPRPLTIAAIPYGLVAKVQDDIWRLGDQSAVIPSFTGDGMSIALHSACLCAALLQGGGRPAALQAAMRRDVARQVKGATLLSVCAVHRPVQHVAVATTRLLPSLAARIAAATRIPDAALRRVGVLPC
jgi:flavin-dependent dehydrogenase